MQEVVISKTSYDWKMRNIRADSLGEPKRDLKNMPLPEKIGSEGKNSLKGFWNILRIREVLGFQAFEIKSNADHRQQSAFDGGV